VLPGGGNSGQKAQKGPGKKELAGRIHGRILAEFWPNFTKSIRKGLKKNVLKKFPFLK
jgi:hypothetical protein